MPDTQRPATEPARALTAEERARLDALGDAEDILTACYFIVCGVRAGEYCAKCDWLLRTLAHVEREQEEIAAVMFPDRAVWETEG